MKHLGSTYDNMDVKMTIFVIQIHGQNEKKDCALGVLLEQATIMCNMNLKIPSQTFQCSFIFNPTVVTCRLFCPETHINTYFVPVVVVNINC
jgi:hypothetical protein